MEGDAGYFARRANEERDASSKAAHPNARQAHLEMAQRYEDLAGAIQLAQRSYDRGRCASRLTSTSSSAFNNSSKQGSSSTGQARSNVGPSNSRSFWVKRPKATMRLLGFTADRTLAKARQCLAFAEPPPPLDE